MHVAWSSVHIQYLFDKRIKHKVTELPVNIKNSFLNALKTVDWMDESAKMYAAIKAKKMTFCVGYPEELLNDTYVNLYYQWVMRK